MSDPKPRIDDIEPDHVASLRAAWARELPHINTVGMSVFGGARRLTICARPKIEAVFAEHGLNAGEFDVLATLRRAGEPFRMRPTEIYRTLMISSGGLTDRLDRLESRGLIERVPDTDDARSQLAGLTSKGCARIEQAFAADMAIECSMLEEIDANDLEQLGILLAKVVGALRRTGA